MEIPVEDAINYYPADSFCPENATCLLPLLHIFKCTPAHFTMEANPINTDQTSPLEGSLIWVHSVCNIG